MPVSAQHLFQCTRLGELPVVYEPAGQSFRKFTNSDPFAKAHCSATLVSASKRVDASAHRVPDDHKPSQHSATVVVVAHSVLDSYLPLLLRETGKPVVAQVPTAWLSNGPPTRFRWLQQLSEEGRTFTLYSGGPDGLQMNCWLILFAHASQRRWLLDEPLAALYCNSLFCAHAVPSSMKALSPSTGHVGAVRTAVRKRK
jgi:hypothetical protein